MYTFEEVIEQIQQHIDCHTQNWLFGAGISYNSKIPLMNPLTEKIEKDIASKFTEHKELFQAIQNNLPENAHIEFILSHIGDLLALLKRSKDNHLVINEYTYTFDNLTNLYKEIISLISEVVRYGYFKNGEIEEIGDITNPIIRIDYHQKFVQELFKRHSDLQNRKRITFFTTNYDTLLEDALAIEKRNIIDGFTGGAIGYWNPLEYDNSEINKYHVYKLHGSIDWYKDENDGLFRNRYGTSYLSNQSNVLIYPQATKYVETQKDPFATLFSSFRDNLQKGNGNILAVCGYSFGDDHINNEIENALCLPNNNTTLVVFIKELWDEINECTFLAPTLEKWRKNPSINDRIFLLTEKGVYNGSSFYSEEDKENYKWWSFEGLTNFLAGEM